MRAIDATGEKYGRLTVLHRDESRKGRAYWVCKCDCGNTHTVRSDYMKSGRTVSCGCYQRDEMSKRMFKHGKSVAGHPDQKDYLDNNNLMRKYGITLEQRDQMHSDQDGKCLICERDFDDTGFPAHVDHCHDTGKIRGLLCKFCNTGLGQFQDNIEWLEAAIKYLKPTR